jgi:hypothetical protein
LPTRPLRNGLFVRILGVTSPRDFHAPSPSTLAGAAAWKRRRRGTPALQKEKRMAGKAEIKKILTIAEIDKLPLGERYKLYKENVISPFKAIKTAQRKATDSLHVAAKVHASLKREYTSLIAAAGAGQVIGTITAGTSEREFFEKHCGGVPSGRVLAVSTFFNAMCMTLVDQAELDNEGKPVLKDGKPVMLQKPLLDEVTQFDPHSGNSLEIAAACIAAERKALPDGWMTTDNTLDVIAAMSTPGDATTKLKEIRARQKGKKEETGEEGGHAPHTIASCIAFLKQAIGSAGDLLKIENGEEVVAELYAETYFRMGNLWETAGVPAEMMAKWTANIERGVALTLEVKSEPEPAKAASEAPAELAEV